MRSHQYAETCGQKNHARDGAQELSSTKAATTCFRFSVLNLFMPVFYPIFLSGQADSCDCGSGRGEEPSGGLFRPIKIRIATFNKSGGIGSI